MDFAIKTVVVGLVGGAVAGISMAYVFDNVAWLLLSAVCAVILAAG